MTVKEEVVSRINTIVSNSGLLFSLHPAIPGWQTTRPGAFEAEVVAFKNPAVEPKFVRLSLRYYEAGETDADGITYGSEAYIVETLDNGSYPWEERSYDTPEAALEDMADIMLDVADHRPVRSELHP